MYNYNIVLFKDKKKKRIIKKFVTLERAKDYFNKLLEESNNTFFEVLYENGEKCTYEIAIVELNSKQTDHVYMTDKMGRQIRVRTNEDGFNIMEIQPFLKEEKIFDQQELKKISVNDFIKKYLKKTEVKIVSVLNNKVIVQKDDDFKLFSMKNELDSLRFVESLSKFFLKEKRTDCMFITDTSTPQKKYLISILISKGFDKNNLYRKYTTFPQSK